MVCVVGGVGVGRALRGRESADNRENKYLDQTLAEQHGILFIFYTGTGDGDKPIISAFKAEVLVLV